MTKRYFPLGRIIDAFTAWLFKRLERKPDDAGVETSNDIIRFRTSMWCGGKQQDF